MWVDHEIPIEGRRAAAQPTGVTPNGTKYQFKINPAVGTRKDNGVIYIDFKRLKPGEDSWTVAAEALLSDRAPTPTKAIYLPQMDDESIEQAIDQLGPRIADLARKKRITIPREIQVIDKNGQDHTILTYDS
jgi:hypothetical protein